MSRVTWLGGGDTFTLNHPDHKVIVRATELNNKNIYVLQIGAALFYYKLEQTLLQIRATVITK